MAILTTSDFSSGRYKIPVNPNQTTDLTSYIDTVEERYLTRMFGKALYDLFIADLVGGVPVTPRFTFIFDAFSDQTDGVLTESEGIKEMLKGFVYYLYVRDRVTRVTTDGVKVTIGENSENMSAIGHDITSRYNEAILTYKVIQNYMFIVDDATYPEYEGVTQRFNHTM